MFEDLAWLTVETLLREATETIRKLQKELADKFKWVSVNDELPPEMEDKTPQSGWSRDIRPSDDVLIWLTVEKRQTVAWYSYEKECWISVDEKTEFLPREVSHWMPLPEPPKEEGGEDV